MNTTAAKVQRAKYLASLKTLANGPREIEQARSEYRTAIDYISDPQTRRTFSPAALDRMKSQALAKRDDTIRSTVSAMRPAIETVKAHKNGSGETLDINDSRIQNTIRTVQAMGKDLSYDAQISIIESFRGDAPALSFVSDLFRRNNLYAADYARSLTREVSDQAIEDMETAIAYYDYGGDFDSGKIHWSKGEFGKALERNAIDPDADPYVAAAVELKHMHRDDANVQQHLGSALSKIAKEQADGNEVDTAAILNDALADMEADG